MLADPANRAFAIERTPRPRARGSPATRCARRSRPLVVEGEAPHALRGLAAPDAIFIGGGASAPGRDRARRRRAAPGGRLVVNAVTLETQADCVDWRARHGGDLVQIAIAHADPVGRFPAGARDADRAMAVVKP